MPKDTFLNLDDKKKQRIIEASMNEFAEYPFSEVKLSKIIKGSKIPRGSFYQYFEDKMDLYKYIFDLLAEEKMKYMGDLLPNPEKMPFIELFEELYTRGIKFATSDARYVKITRYLLLSGGDLLQEVFGDKLDIGRQFYIGYIEADKKLGRIREDVDSEILADLVIQFTTNIAFDEIQKNDTFDVERMFKKSIKIIQMLKKGIE
jgi:AcrR family transcriptional regulator